MKKVWKIKGGGRQIEDTETLIDVLLANRGIDAKHKQAFFSSSYVTDIHNPYDIAHMEKAVSRIVRAIKNGERIMVYGDYDADGITATAIMVRTLSDIGAHVIPYLPHRYDDGYGLSRQALLAMRPEFDVLITVDCGISNREEVEMLTADHVDVIIVDHHEIPEVMPKAYAILHPRHPDGSYPWGHLCGAGMAWKFSQALLRHEDSPYKDDADREKWLLDLVMLGTIADVMPLLGENRAIVRFGKEIFMRTKNPGIAALLAQTRVDPKTMSAEDVAFRIVPLLNAAGRMEHPQSALNALLAGSAAQAKDAVAKLVQLNNARRALTKKMMDEAHIDIDHSLPFVFVSNSAWPAGIVGLVAGRLASTFAKPAFVVGGHTSLAHAVGSARGAGSANVLRALETVREHTLKLGGHKAAAGFSVLPEKLEEIREGLKEYFINEKDSTTGEVYEADAIASHDIISWDSASLLETFEPFGEGNPKPLFILQDMKMLAGRTVGKSNDHLKASFLVGDREVDGIGFGLGDGSESLGDRVDVLASIGVSEFRGKERLELRLEDIAPKGSIDII